MRTSRFLAAGLLVLIASVAACGGNSDDADSGGSDGTVSVADWRRAADQECADTRSAIESILTSTPSLADPQDAQQLAQADTALAELISTLDGVVRGLDDMSQPDSESDAEQANAVVEALGKALASLRDVQQAASAGDLAAYSTAYETYTQDAAAYAEAASAAGLEQCGQAIIG